MRLKDPKLALATSLILGVIASVCAWWALAPGFEHGLDISDEGFYLVAADAPGPEYAFVGFFGLYLAPLFSLVDHDVAAYRAVGAVLMFAAGGFAGWSLWTLLRQRLSVDSVAAAIGFGTAGAVASLGYNSLYLITPSYNWLAVFGMLIGCGGLAGLVGRKRSWAVDLSWTGVFSAGAFLAAVARPAAGLLLWAMGIVVIVAFAEGKFLRRMLVAAFSGGWLCVYLALHLIFVASPAISREILERTQYVAESGAEGGSLLGFLTTAWTQITQVPSGVWNLAGFALLAGFLPLLGWLAPRERRAQVAAVLVLVAGVVVVVVCELNGGFRAGGKVVTGGVSYAWLATVLVALVAYLAAMFVSSRGIEREPTRSGIAFVLVTALVLIGFAMAFGISSINGVINQFVFSSVFLALAAVVLFVGAARELTGVLTWVAVGLVTVTVVTALLSAQSTPYRTVAVAQATDSTVVTADDSQLYLAPENAEVFNRMESAATAGGFTRGTPLADFSTFSPGIGYRLGSLPPTTLMLGQTRRSTLWALEQQDKSVWCGAWLLTSPNAPGREDPGPVLPKAIGTSFPADYVTLNTSLWEHGRSRPGQGNILELWRPKPAAVAACQAKARR